jgi:rod shape-determining protein MreD
VKRIVAHIVLIIVCFVLQATLFYRWAFAGIVPNLLIIAIASLGFMRGERTGLLAGFFAGLLVDIFFGDVIGLYAMVYMYIGFLNGKFNGIFYAENIKLPLLMIMASDLAYGLFTYMLLFMMRSRLHFDYYFTNVIFPEIIYTVLAALLLYPLILLFHNLLEGRRRPRRKSADA